jgi:hypothetical protein
MEAPGAAPTPAAAMRRCARCGLNDSISPGRCCFHPALIGGPGPLLYGPEWHACQAAGHVPTSEGCFRRAEHYYPLLLPRLLERQAVAGRSSSPASAGSPGSSRGSASPRPRRGLPLAWAS